MIQVTHKHRNWDAGTSTITSGIDAETEQSYADQLAKMIAAKLNACTVTVKLDVSVQMLVESAKGGGK